MTVWNSLRSTFVSALQHQRLWLLQFFGNIVVALLFVLWLRIPDSYWWQLLFQFVVAVAGLVGVLVLHGGTLNYYSDLAKEGKSPLPSAFWRAMKHLPAFVIAVAIFYFVLYFVDKLDDYQYQFPGYLRSEFPAWLRRLVSENAMDNLYLGFVAFLRWTVVPGLLLPLWLLCADIGFRAFGQLRFWGQALRSLSYWIVLILAGLIGVYCTGKLMHWMLDSNGPAVTKEGIWLGFRMLIAYLLALFSWFWVCSMLARARSRPGPPAAEQKVAA